MSSSLGDKPVKCDDLPVLLGSSPASEQKESHDFEVIRELV